MSPRMRHDRPTMIRGRVTPWINTRSVTKVDALYARITQARLKRDYARRTEARPPEEGTEPHPSQEGA